MSGNSTFSCIQIVLKIASSGNSSSNFAKRSQQLIWKDKVLGQMPWLFIAGRDRQAPFYTKWPTILYRMTFRDYFLKDS